MAAPLQPAGAFQDLTVWGKAHEWEEASRFLNAYAKAIQAAVAGHSDSRLLTPVSSRGSL
jgi:hypothetical protein